MASARSREEQTLAQARDLLQKGDARKAIALARRVLQRAPDSVPALHLLASALMSAGDLAPARHALTRAMRLAPDEAGFHRMLAYIHRLENNFASAHAVLDEALQRRPGDSAVRAAKAHLHYISGEFEQAYDLLRHEAESGAMTAAAAQAFAVVSPKVGRRADGIAALQACLARGGLSANDRARLLFTLGEALDAEERYDEAFAAIREANQLRGARSDAPEYEASVEQMLAAWTREAAVNLPRAASMAGDDCPVFIVGMPRSGTSLLEQILASHSSIFGAGERADLQHFVREIQGEQNPWHLVRTASLTQRRIDGFARKYLAGLRRVAPNALRITDKHPYNFLHLGLAACLCPRGRAIHCVREPMDTCLSFYFHNIVGDDRPSHDLKSIGRWFRLMERVMAHWKDVLPPWPILTVQYEELINHQEAVTRRVVEFLGLPWEDALLRFHETRRHTLTPSVDQVRQPLFRSSIGRYRNYAGHLAPLEQGLQGS